MERANEVGQLITAQFGRARRNRSARSFVQNPRYSNGRGQGVSTTTIRSLVMDRSSSTPREKKTDVTFFVFRAKKNYWDNYLMGRIRCKSVWVSLLLLLWISLF